MMDSGYDAGGSTALEMQIQVLRAELSSSRVACHEIVERVAQDRKPGRSADVATPSHVAAIQHYLATAQTLLSLVPDDDAANAALVDAEGLKRRIAGSA